LMMKQSTGLLYFNDTDEAINSKIKG